MAHTAPVLACFFLGLFILSASLADMQMLPSWLQVPMLHLRSLGGDSANHDGDIADLSDPVALLRAQLQKLDVAHEPKTARDLHTALGKILQASDAQSEEAVQHLEAARDAASRLDDTDALVQAHIDLADAYLEQGRPTDSLRELPSAYHLSYNHFREHYSKIHRGRGRAKFEMGFKESALQCFKSAKQFAVESDDKVRATCDIAMVQTCFGKASETVQPLRQALEELNAARKAGSEGGMPTSLYNMLAADVHFHLAEAFHALESSDFARAHYMKALNLQQKSPVPKAARVKAIKRAITFLDNGINPELHCPSLKGPAVLEKEGTPKPQNEAAEFPEHPTAVIV